MSLLLLTLLIFAVTRTTGDPVNLLLPEEASQAQREKLTQDLGLDQPLLMQYVNFVGSISRGEFGVSYRQRIPVATLVARRFPQTMMLAAASLLITLVVSIPLGVYAASHRGGWVDGLARGLAIIGQSAPTFWIGLILVLIFAIKLRVLPAGGYGGVDHLLLPAVTVALAPIAGLTRLIRSSMIEVLQADYIKFLRLKGLPENQVLWKHALRNAGLNALTFVGVLIAHLLTGTIVVETVFVWPGMGQLMSQAITGRDFAVVQGVVIIFAAIYIGMNLITDVLYGVLNPRLRATR